MGYDVRGGESFRQYSPEKSEGAVAEISILQQPHFI
jgi:hypothetical protein